MADVLLHQFGRPVLLDVYCGAGGIAKGYYDAGFEVVGVDLEDQPNYPYEFHRADALAVLAETVNPPTGFGPDKRGTGPVASAAGPLSLTRFSAIHASPPCQSYLNLGQVNRRLGRDYQHADLIAATRELLLQAELPYVIENVEDAKTELRDPIRLCGSSFGLPLRRHRLFESNVPLVGPPCNHRWQKVKRYWTGWRPKGETVKATVVQIYGNGGGREEWPAAMGIDWMTSAELCEAVPPAYSEFLGRQLIRFVELAEHERLAA